MLNWLYDRIGIVAAPRASNLLSFLGIPITFVLVCFTWVFFRSPDFSSAWKISGAMLGLSTPMVQQVTLRTYEILIIGAAALLVVAEPLIVRGVERNGIDGWWHLSPVVRGTVYALFILVLVVFGGSVQKFIYFDF